MSAAMLASPEVAKPVGDALAWFYWAGGALGAVVLGYLGYSKKPREELRSALTVSGALLSNEAVDPLRGDIKQLIDAIGVLARVMGAEAEEREEDERKRELRQEFEAERRMEELMARVNQIIDQKKI